MVWIQIRTDNLLVLIWVQTVCKCYQQMTKVLTTIMGKVVKGSDQQTHPQKTVAPIIRQQEAVNSTFTEKFCK